jgi:hypothetical protein
MSLIDYNLRLVAANRLEKRNPLRFLSYGQLNLFINSIPVSKYASNANTSFPASRIAKSRAALLAG